MKIKVSKKQLKENYNKIISVGYGDLQHLLKYQNAQTYCTRAEGWACDNYDIDGVLISTGYSTIGNKNTKRVYETIREYDDKAMKIESNYSLDWTERKDKINNLLKEFIKECEVV